MALYLILLFFSYSSAMEQNPHDFVNFTSCHENHLKYLPADLKRSLVGYLAYQAKQILPPPEIAAQVERKVLSKKACCLQADSQDDLVISITDDGQLSFFNVMTKENILCSDETLTPYCSTLDLKDKALWIGGKYGAIDKWDYKEPKSILGFKGHKGTVTSLSIFDRRLVSANVNGTIKIWDLDSTKKLQKVSCREHIKNAFLLPCQTLLYAKLTGSIEQYDVQKKLLVSSIALGDRISRLHLFGSVSLAAYSKQENNKEVNNIAIFDPRQEKSTNFCEVEKLTDLHTDGEWPYFVSGGWEGTLKVWDIRMNSHLAVLAYKNEWAPSITSLNKMKKIVCPTISQSLKVWDISSVHYEEYSLSKMIGKLDAIAKMPKEIEKPDHVKK